MNDKQNTFKTPFHYGWIIAACCVILAGAGSGLFVSTLGVFVKPICDDLGFTRASFTIYSTIFFIVNVTLMPVYGSLFQKYGFRRIASICSVLLTVSLIGYSFSRELWQFYACAFLSGFFINGINSMALGVLLNRWFIDKRGLASGFAFSGSTVLAAILLPICTPLIEAHGWEWTYRFLAVVELCLTLPIILFVIKDDPNDMGLEPYRDGSSVSVQTKTAEEAGLTRREAFKTLPFWLLFIAIFLLAVCQAGPNSNTVSILQDIGYTAEYAATASSVYMVIITLCKIGMGYLFDRIGSLRGSMVIGICCMLFPLVALFAQIPGIPYVYITLLAIAGSGSTVMGNVLTANYFGRRDFSRIYSLIALATQLGAAFSTPLMSWIYDTTDAYTAAWYLLTVLGVIVCASLFLSYRGSRKLAIQ